ncbi:hypothetical protein [Vibrio quintilis]|uniref:Outer membrane lipoprotein BfpB n=1 Tax=Vibrio quintilis TaxID=1117707 RepID=A0A1M7YSG5_9VIBR|nr:hypothetical protein [Vibrio quintilis]SHO55558.1 hypothetical protein VQ7734_01294 [Vibrio quintilis]
MKGKILAALLIVLALSGCVSRLYDDNTKASHQVKEEITSQVAKINYDKAIRIDLPPFDKAEFDDSASPAWLKKRISYSVAGVSLSIVLHQIMNDADGRPPEIIYGEDVDPNVPVSLSLPEGTVKEAFNLLTSATDYGFVFGENKIEVRRFISSSFSIPLPPGVYSSQMGNQGTKSSDDEGAIVEGQFINTVIKDQNLIEKVLNNIKGLLKTTVHEKNDDKHLFSGGTVTAIDGLSMIHVTTSPSKMHQVERYIESVKKSLSRQVLLDFRVLEFRATNGNERGVDLNLVRDIGDGTLKFFTQGTSLYSSTNGYGFSFTGVNGWEGTTAFIKALEKQGTVSVERPLTQLALNNIPVRLTQNRNNPYLEKVSTTVDDGVVTTDFTRGNVIEGIDIASVANVEDDFAWVRVAGNINSVVDTELRKVGNNKVRFYTTRTSDINFTGKIRYGRTYIISRVSETKLKSDKTRNLGTDYIGSNATQKEHVETLVLLTPRRFEQ